MQYIIFNYENCYDKILIMEMSRMTYYKINLFDVNKDKFIFMFKYIFGDATVFDFNIAINNEYYGNNGKTIYNFDVYSYYTAEKFYDYIQYQRVNNEYMPFILNLWKDFEIDKFIQGWKNTGYQVGYVEKIEKIYNELVIKSIIE